MRLPVYIIDCECGHRYASNFRQSDCVYCHSSNIQLIVEDEGDYTSEEYNAFISNAHLMRITGAITPPGLDQLDAIILTRESRN